MSKFYFTLIFIALLQSGTGWAETSQNYYDVLGVSRQATSKDIRQAYHKLARKWHPDVHSEKDKEKAHQKMREITQAYSVLKNPEARKRYDDFGHESFNEFGNKEKEDIFKSIWKKEKKTDGEKIQFSDRALYLFKIILNNKQLFQENNSSKNKKQAEFVLREFLKEVKISSLNGNRSTFQRILKDFYMDFSEQEREKLLNVINNKDSSTNDLERKEILRTALQHFTDSIVERYGISSITPGERKALEIFHEFSFFRQNPKEYIIERNLHMELLEKEKEDKLDKQEEVRLRAFEKRDRKDTAVFKRVLGALGLPEQVQNSFLVKVYLDGLKESLMTNQSFEKGRMLESRHHKGYKTVYRSDERIIEILRQVKNNFDDLHLKNLRQMLNPVAFFKSYPTQFIVFTAAIGASLYRQSLTDHYIYGEERSPGMGGTAVSENLTMVGIISFAIFIYFNQATNWALYKFAGRGMDGRALRTRFGNIHFNGKLGRSIAPGLGLGLGFSASALFTELVTDPNLRKCASTLYSSKEESIVNSHKDPCEMAYTHWSSTDKWRHLLVDAGTLIGSGMISHKVLMQVLKAVRATPIGAKALMKFTKFAGLRLTGLLGFFVHMYSFMEWHKVLDHYIGQPFKEHWTGSKVRNDLLAWTRDVEQNFHEMPIVFSEDSENPSPYLKKTFLNMEHDIKGLGHRFQKWSVRGQQLYGQSAYMWSQELNKVFLPYEGSAQFLKDMFVLSHFKHGSPINVNIHFPWDSEGALQSEQDWNEMNQMISFSGIDFDEKKKLLKRKYCPFVGNHLPAWKQFCSDEEVSALNTGNPELFVETAQMLANYINVIPLKKENITDEDLIHYTGKDLNEIFSSDPAYSTKNLSYDERFQLSRVFINTGLDSEDPASYLSSSDIAVLKQGICSSMFPNHETDEESAQFYRYCQYSSEHQEEIHNTCQNWLAESEIEEDYQINYISCVLSFNSDGMIADKLRTKFLGAGVYLLKELVSDLKTGYVQSKAWPEKMKEKPEDYAYYHPDINNVDIFQSILPLLDLLDVYKKGEQIFHVSEKILEYQNNLSPAEGGGGNDHKLFFNLYSFAGGLICGGEREEAPYFTLRQFFNTEGVKIYNFKQERFEDLESTCERYNFSSSDLSKSKKAFHDVLFNRPVQMNRENYGNLYLALEASLKRNYVSTEDLANQFQNLSRGDLLALRHELADGLDTLTETYYKSMINTECAVNQDSSLDSFLSYYDKNNILFNFASFKNLTGLEAMIFQVNHWMNVLKQMLIIGDQTNLNQKFKFKDWNGLDKSSFEKAQLEVLSLLQSYHDTYKVKRRQYIKFPKKEFALKLEETYREKGKEGLAEIFGGNGSRMTILQNEYKDQSLPVMTDPNIILSHILSGSTPAWDHPAYLNLINQSLTIYDKGSWEQAVYSVTLELQNSLHSFFQQLQAIGTAESFKKRIQEAL